MSAIGAMCAGTTVALLILATRRRSRVARHLSFIRPVRTIAARLRPIGMAATDALVASGLGWTAEQLAVAKVAAALGAGLAAGVASLLVPIGPLVVITVAYGGFIAPSLLVERRAAARLVEAERATGSLIEWTYAIVASGRPVETALVTLARRGTGAPLVDEALARVERDYTLGAPLHAALAREARAASLTTLARLAERLDRARELGHGSLAVLQDVRDEIRTATRDRALEAASKVEGTLTLILTLCYLPALALLVVIPLFLTLLAGLFA